MSEGSASNTAAPDETPPGWRRWLDLLLPPTQLIGPDAADHAGWQPDRPGTYCPRCGATVQRAAVTVSGCPHCRERRIPWDGLWRLGAYEPPLSEWIVALKFHRCWSWPPWFAESLAGQLPPPETGQRTAVVPVPLHWRRRLARGYNQATLIGRHLARRQGLPLAPVLRRRRPTRPQPQMTDRRLRRKNVARAFAIEPVDLTGWRVWLVDDVVTTGFTAAACTRLLRRAGADRIFIATCAVADPKHADFQQK